MYFAEREGDVQIGTRLVNCGAVSTAQFEHGAVQIGETSSLARLFQREPSIDRDEVELTLELATESLLESVANKAVGMPEVFPLRHHSSGVHHWLRSAATSAALALPAVDEPFVMEEVFALDSPSQVAAIVEEAVAEQSPNPEPLLALMPTLASLTLPTLQNASATDAAPRSIVAVKPTLASTSDDFFSSLPEPATFAPTNPYEPAEPSTGLPKLASAPISMNDLAVANALPASPFGEPTHNLAAVDIWEMVDVLTDDGREGEQEPVGSSEKQGRSWLRGQKG